MNNENYYRIDINDSSEYRCGNKCVWSVDNFIPQSQYPLIFSFHDCNEIFLCPFGFSVSAPLLNLSFNTVDNRPLWWWWWWWWWWQTTMNDENYYPIDINGSPEYRCGNKCATTVYFLRRHRSQRILFWCWVPTLYLRFNLFDTRTQLPSMTGEVSLKVIDAKWEFWRRWCLSNKSIFVKFGSVLD